MIQLANQRRVLIVDDSKDDQELTRIAFDRAAASVEVSSVSSGEEALDYLRLRGKYADAASAPRPHLVLLDLNLCGIDGREVLRQIRSDMRLRRLPVIMFTSSAFEKDVESCLDIGCNAYLIKPASMMELIDMVGSLASFWFNFAHN